MILDVIIDAFIDTAKLLPFLFLTYLAMEWLEHRTEEKTKDMVKKAGHMGPLIGGLLGAVPQCGFSAAASSLYAGRVITIGTLIAIYLSTSDEMLPIFLSSDKIGMGLMVKILLLKALAGVAAGFGIDALHHFLIMKGVLHKRYMLPGSTDPRILQEEPGSEHIKDLCEQENCNCEENNVFLSALLHTLQVAAFILIVNFGLNLCFSLIGEEFLAGSIFHHGILGPIVSGLVGLIPNCASSVAITQFYLAGAMNAASMLAGLLVNAGVGIIVLLKSNKNFIENLKIIGLLYGCGVILGMLLGLFF